MRLNTRRRKSCEIRTRSPSGSRGLSNNVPKTRGSNRVKRKTKQNSQRVRNRWRKTDATGVFRERDTVEQACPTEAKPADITGGSWRNAYLSLFVCSPALPDLHGLLYGASCLVRLYSRSHHGQLAIRRVSAELLRFDVRHYWLSTTTTDHIPRDGLCAGFHLVPRPPVVPGCLQHCLPVRSARTHVCSYPDAAAPRLPTGFRRGLRPVHDFTMQVVSIWQHVGPVAS